MKVRDINFSVEVYAASEDLEPADKELLELARATTASAYAPYSNFFVGAAASLINGSTVAGTNQENASYPAGICAERVLLSAAATLHPGIGINTLAISYNNNNLNGESKRPISPCGICRQSLSEYEERTSHPIRVILAGLTGEVYVIQRASQLLPLSFSGGDMK